MRSIREQLQPGEEVLFVAHPTRIALHASLVGIVLLGLAAAILFVQFVMIPLALVCLVAMIPLLLIILQKWIFLISNQFILTNRRVLKQTGLFSKQSTTSYLDKINNVEHRQSFWGRMLNFGDVEVDTASETGTTIFRSITEPLAFQRAILTASESYRMSRGGFAPAAAPASTGADRMRDLKRLLDEGLISQAEFEEKRRKLLAEL
jgi:membrane protein YdbS with pleckstrin-like domain